MGLCRHLFARADLRGWAALLLGVVGSGCAEVEADDRFAFVVSSMVAEDAPLLRARGDLVAGKYAAMSESVFAFYRGNMSLFVRDQARAAGPFATGATASRRTMPFCLGDPHPENFGLLAAADGTLALEPNDFDAADRFPFVWDLRRLLTGIVLAARASNSDDPEAQSAAAEAGAALAEAAVLAYVAVLDAAVAGTPRVRVDNPGDEPVLEDLFERGLEDRDTRGELGELTQIDDGGGRTLLRGVVDPDDPAEQHLELAPFARRALVDALARYRMTLVAPPPPEYVTLLDAVRKRGAGVASFPRVRVLVLVRGPSDAPEDDVVLELKEIGNTPSAGWLEPGVHFGSASERVGAARMFWALPDADPLFGTTDWLGFPMLVRTESAAHKNLRVARLRGKRGRVEALTGMARTLGGLVGRAHAAGGDAAAIRSAIGDEPSAFAARHTQAALRYADVVEQDYGLFVRALELLGPTLGLVAQPEDLSPSELHSLLEPALEEP